MLNYHYLKNRVFDDIDQTYTHDLTMLYALAIGVGSDPCDERALRYVNDVVPGTPVALPTLCTVVGFPGTWIREPATGIDGLKIVHGEEKVELHSPMPAAATVRARHRVTRVVDKGPGRGAIVTYQKELTDLSNGVHFATVTHTSFCRGDGGFSAHDGATDEAAPPPRKTPAGPCDLSMDLKTLPQQALIYRLLTDRNPLHSEPSVARAAGFDRPILHGLCTYGMAGYAVVASCCGHEPARLKSLFTRFSAPVIPGETVRFEFYRQDDGVAFRALALERNAVVLDSGYAEIA